MARTKGANALKLVQSDLSTRGPIPGDTSDSFQSRTTASRPNKPASVAGNREMSRVWDELVPPLVEAGILTSIDGPALELAIWHWKVALDSAKMLDSEGLTTPGASGLNIVAHPASTVMRGHTKSFLTFAAQLGMTFSARARVKLPEESDDSNPFG